VKADENIPDPLINFTLDHRILTRAGKALEGITEAIATIQEEHQRFTQETKHVEQVLFNSTHQSLAELKRMATELRREMEYMSVAISKSIDVVSNFSPFPSLC
jgi:predicted aconitase